jgi:hypothetical protein
MGGQECRGQAQTASPAAHYSLLFIIFAAAISEICIRQTLKRIYT